jgi:hypothetical protein
MQGKLNEDSFKQEDLDLSCFPLLRIDQLHLHDSDVLMRSLKELKSIIEEEDSPVIRNYSFRLIKLIQVELSKRSLPMIQVLSTTYETEENENAVEGSRLESFEVVRKNNTPYTMKIKNEYWKYARIVQCNKHDPSVPCQDRRHHVKDLNRKSIKPSCFHSNAFFVAPNLSSNKGFKSRAHLRVHSMKLRAIKNSEEYRIQQIEQNKLLRRMEAEKRINEQRATAKKKQDKMRQQDKRRQNELENKIMQEMKQTEQKYTEEVVHSLIEITKTI